MRLTNKQILNLPVYTVSQDFLGRIASFNIDSEDRNITTYHIGVSSFVKKLLSNTPELIISDAQVISVTEEKMTVKDAVIKEEVQEEKESSQEQVANTAPLTSKSD
ncbi:MAG: hypothetical protein ABH835_04910 [Patescibacteria group bacterium]|nr:hypothetical protein [Patescibacteria group bacterium]